MSEPQRTVEHRIIEAVVIVLAGCAPTPLDPHAPFGAAAIAGAPDYATVPGEPSVDRVANAAPDAETKPASLCSQYKEMVTVDVTRASQIGGVLPGAEVLDSAAWDPKRELVVCVIVRSRDEVTVPNLQPSSHCPTPALPASLPAPPPSSAEVQVPGIRAVVEQAELHPDGTIASSRLGVRSYAKSLPPLHTCGRKPAGLVLQSRESTGVGAELAQMAELEAASVPAFDRLARELRAHGAPPELVARARAAARDEVRHARTMTRLAEAYGATPSAPRHAALAVRSLLPIAIENAIEGCVREAYGALVASFQAERAAPALRSTFAAVAADERAHAALSEDVDRWLADALDASARAEVEAARQSALVELRGALEHATPCDTLGLPDRASSVALFDAYFA